MRRAVCSAVLCCLLVASATRPALARGPAPEPVTYSSPVDGVAITDRFRPPPAPWEAGNRGVDFATVPGTPVRAAADGVVVFAGVVAGSRHVVVLHADGIRTGYSFLESVTVRRGDRVEAGHAVGLAGGPFHFAARAGDTYLDPEELLGAGRPRVRLVPEAARRPAPEADERRGIERLLGALPARVGRVGAAAIGWARSGLGAAERLAVNQARAAIEERLQAARDLVAEVRQWAHVLQAVNALNNPTMLALRLGDAVWAWRRALGHCTPPGVSPPPLAERHLLVEVAGLGSHTGGDPAHPTRAGAVTAVDGESLGYRPDDVLEFSYRGGTTAEQPYRAADTQVDLRESARRLRELLERLRADHPGVPVDIVAHSQGGLVVRGALGDEYARFDARLPPIGTVVTLGTPHHGADVATAAALVGHTGLGAQVGRVAGVVKPGGIDPGSPSVGQLAETSGYLAELNRRPLPKGVHVVSIAARGDAVVPSSRSHLDGATNVIVDVGGWLGQHSDLPAAPAARREIALALAGRPPTCESLADAVADAAVGHVLANGEDVAGGALAYAVQRLGRKGN